MQALTDIDILNLKYYTFAKGRFAGIDNVLISATGYTGAGGIEIYFEDKGDAAATIWNRIFESGQSPGTETHRSGRARYAPARNGVLSLR